MDRNAILAALVPLVGKPTPDGGWRMGAMATEHGIQATHTRRQGYEQEYVRLHDALRKLDGRPRLRKKYRRA